MGVDKKSEMTLPTLINLHPNEYSQEVNNFTTIHFFLN